MYDTRTSHLDTVWFSRTKALHQDWGERTARRLFDDRSEAALGTVGWRVRVAHARKLIGAGIWILSALGRVSAQDPKVNPTDPTSVARTENNILARVMDGIALTPPQRLRARAIIHES
jgi:hypothetical protein